MAQTMEDFLDEVDWVTKEIEGVMSGKIDVEASENKEKYKLQAKLQEQQRIEENIKKGREGKGIKFDRYKSYCKYCMREFDLETPNCTLCGKNTITSEQRKLELTEKVNEYKIQKSKKDENKLRWENWKKTEAMLYKKNGTNYKKWEFFEDDDEVEPETDFIPPDNDPNFAALEKDIKERGERRKKDTAAAMVLKEQGNDYYKQGKYRNAIVKYEEALELKKDLMVLYTNCAAARLRIDDFDGAIKDCSRVIDYFEVFEKELEANKDTVFKALFRRGDAYRGLHKYCEAVVDYEKSLEIKQEKEIESLLERCREEAAESSLSTITEEIEDSELIMSKLNTPENIQSFRVSGGYKILFKKIYETMDLQALNVLEFLMADENKFISLQPLTLPLYDKRKTAAIVMLETLAKYRENNEFSVRLAKLLSLSIENSHVREEIAKHSATTKGKKFYREIFEIFVSNPSFVKTLVPIISNLCLTIQKTAFDRKPSPGNMKSIIRYGWKQFVSVFSQLLESAPTESLGLLCNISTDVKVKRLILEERFFLTKAIEILLTSTKSINAERASGILINLLTQPTSIEKLEDLLEDIWKANIRLFQLEASNEILDDRAFKLLFRLLIAKPSLVENLILNINSTTYILNHIDSPHADTITKILAASTASKVFCTMIDIDTIALNLYQLIEKHLNGALVDERIGNLCLAVGRISSNCPEASLKFTRSIAGLVRIIKEKLGPVRKNVAVCLGKLCNNDINKEAMREVHGVEVLASVMPFINK